MADLKITELTAHSSPIGTDLLPIVDITAVVTKKITLNDLIPFFSSGLLPAGTDGQTLRYNGTALEANSILTNDGTKIAITANSAGIHDILTLKNLNSSAPVYIVFKNAAGAEKFYMGYRQAVGRLDMIAEGVNTGVMVDSTGRTVIGSPNATYVAPDTGHILSVDTISSIGAFGMALRRFEASGGQPISFMFEDSTLSSASIFDYAKIQGEVVSNTPGAYTGKLILQVANAGALVANQLVLDSTSLALSPHGTGAGNTLELRFLELAAGGTNYVGFKAADALAGSLVWTLPVGDSTGTQALVSNGSGVLSWATITGGGGFTLINGSGTTAVTDHVDLGGTLTSNVVIDGDTNTYGVTLENLSDFLVETSGDIEMNPAGLFYLNIGDDKFKIKNLTTGALQEKFMMWDSSDFLVRVREMNSLGFLVANNNLSDLTDPGDGRLALGVTTVGDAIFTLPNPSAISFIRINADNSVTAQSAANFLTDISAANRALSNLASVSINTSLVPQANIDLGTTAANFRDAWISRNILIATPTSAASAAGTIQVTNATPPSGNITDGFTMYSADITAGNAVPTFRTENGQIIKLYTGGAITSPQEIADSLTAHGLLASSTIMTPIAQGGTNKALTLVNGGVVWSDADSFEITAAGTAGQYLKSNAAAAPSWADNCIGILSFSCGSGNTIAASTTAYGQFFFGNSVGTNEGVRTITILQPCTIKNLLMRTSNGQSATGSLVLMIRKNSGNTTLTLTMAAGSGPATFTDLVNSFTLAALDTISIQFINNATATSANVLEVACWMYAL